MYAKFIKHLEFAICEYSDVRSVLNSQALLAYAESNTLLPNLRSFSIESYYNHEATFDWAVGLFSSSLLEIRCKPHRGARPPLPLGATLNWLKSILVKCPALETLELHPYSHRLDWGEEAPQWLLQEDNYTRNCFGEPLRHLTQLRSLHVNTYLTARDHIRALSCLPKLERLEISTGHQLDALVHQADLAPDAFPMLRHLALHNLGWLDLNSVWKMERLIQCLQSLDLIIKPQSTEDVMLFHWIPHDIAPTLHQLTHLFVGLDILENRKIKIIHEMILEDLSPLPLQCVHIRGGQVDPYGWGERHPCEILASIWPRIQELHWPDQPATSRDLAYFAALPYLRHLTLNVKLMPAPKDVDDIVAGPGAFRVLECSKPKPFRSTAESRKEAARQVSILISIIPYLN